MEPEGSLPWSEEPTTIVSQMSPIQILKHISLVHILISSSHLRPGFPSGFFPLGFLTKYICISYLSRASHMS